MGLKVLAVLLVTLVLASVPVTEARAADDSYCAGARYKLGEPFIDNSKVRPNQLTDFGLDPIVRVDRVQRIDAGIERTIAYVYYNQAGLAAVAPAPSPIMTAADRDAFVALAARVGIPLLSSEIAGPPTFGNGFIRMFVGTKISKALDGDLKLAECMKLPRDLDRPDEFGRSATSVVVVHH